jgi:N-acetylglucosaminyl-diphospho-decaprenol L-rhamnosyltransferase
VVDNGSTDGSAELVREEFPDVELFVSRENRGFAVANNLGIRRARGRYVLLLNADTEIAPDAAGELYRFMEARPDVGLAGARLVFPDGRDQDCAFEFPTLAMAFLDVFPLHHRLLGGRLNGRYRVAGRAEPFPIGHPLGACMFVRREALEQVGLLDEGFFMYAEEVDWCLRLRRAGWGIYCVPTAVVVHYGGASAGQFREAMLVELYRSRYRLFRRHYTRRYQTAARLIFRAGHLWAALRLRLAARGRVLQAEERARLRAHRRILGLR